jgi:Co/Zn/Cd efflux system component
MSDACCEPNAIDTGRRRRVLWIVLGINAAMFVVELSAGLIAGSVALQADSLDMLGDTLVYGFSLMVVGGSLSSRARAAQLKGWIMLGFGVAVLVQVIAKILSAAPPNALLISGTGLLALVANLTCLGLLYRHRSDDVNMRSTWICSRNDIAANLGVLLAAAGVAVTGSVWPDIAVSLCIVTLFLWSASAVLQAAARELRLARA